MKDRQSLRGFTLIELLVVIGIIAILMGLLFSVGPGVLDRTKKVQAKNDLTQIVTAVNAFYTEYGKFPVVNYETPLTTADNIDLFYTLRGVAGGSGKSTTENPRQIRFIEPPESSDPTPKGKIGSNGQFYDPWATPYQIAMDGTYDGDIPNPYQGNTGAGPDLLHQNAIGWSCGKDTKCPNINSGTTTFRSSDDVISWQ